MKRFKLTGYIWFDDSELAELEDPSDPFGALSEELRMTLEDIELEPAPE